MLHIPAQKFTTSLPGDVLTRNATGKLAGTMPTTEINIYFRVADGTSPNIAALRESVTRQHSGIVGHSFCRSIWYCKNKKKVILKVANTWNCTHELLITAILAYTSKLQHITHDVPISLLPNTTVLTIECQHEDDIYLALYIIDFRFM